MSTAPTRVALVVRGGWDGHQPVEATDMFLPFLEENGFSVRIEESPAVYADAEEVFSERELGQVIAMAVTINAWNRINAAVHTPPPRR